MDAEKKILRRILQTKIVAHTRIFLWLSLWFLNFVRRIMTLSCLFRFTRMSFIELLGGKGVYILFCIYLYAYASIAWQIGFQAENAYAIQYSFLLQSFYVNFDALFVSFTFIPYQFLLKLSLHGACVFLCVCLRMSAHNILIILYRIKWENMFLWSLARINMLIK